MSPGPVASPIPIDLDIAAAGPGPSQQPGDIRIYLDQTSAIRREHLVRRICSRFRLGLSSGMIK